MRFAYASILASAEYVRKLEELYDFVNDNVDKLAELKKCTKCDIDESTYFYLCPFPVQITVVRGNLQIMFGNKNIDQLIGEIRKIGAKEVEATSIICLENNCTLRRTVLWNGRCYLDYVDDSCNTYGIRNKECGCFSIGNLARGVLYKSASCQCEHSDDFETLILEDEEMKKFAEIISL